MSKEMYKYDAKDVYEDFKNMTKKQLIDKYKCKTDTVRFYLKRMGYEVKTVTEYKIERNFKNFSKLIDDGFAVSDISKITKFSDDCIRETLKKYNKEFNRKEKYFFKTVEDINKNFEDEVWILLKNNENYAISNYGRLYSFKSNIYIAFGEFKTGKNKGYRMYNICGETKRVHRLVAEHFIENKNNYKEVNHIDSDKSNNYYKNLEWCNRSQNVKHMLSNPNNYNNIVVRARMAGMKNAKEVVCLNDGKIYSSISEASRYYGVKVQSVSYVCSGKYKKTKDLNGQYLVFKYKEGTNE